MIHRCVAPAVIALVLLSLGGCSKTADTAPATRLFGDPPIFEGAPSVDQLGGQTSVLCDFTDAFNYSLPLALSSKVQVAGTVLVGGSYTQFFLKARVTDPNPAPSSAFPTDILSVFASYVQGDREITLVLFDDGGALLDSHGNITFPYGQTAQILESCGFDSNCTTTAPCCKQWTNIPLGSNDPTAGDGNYTRGFALVNLNTNNDQATKLFQDCIAQKNHQVPVPASPNTVITFRSGDDCLCCWLQYGSGAVTDLNGRCRGLPGLYGPDAPDGFCNVSPPPT